MELEKLASIEHATWAGRKEFLRLGVALLFIVGIMLFVGSKYGEVSYMLVVAAMIGGYMAMNIGANDVANNVGPAVGSRAITLTGAILLAAIFEAMGALIAGGEVVGTIKKGIIDPALIANTDVFIWLMMAALLAGALWLNLATAIGAPVSTTHSIVGGVLGAGIAAGRVGDSQLAQDGSDCRQLGDFAGAGWHHRCRLSLSHQTDHHLSDRYAGSGQAHGADPDRCNGVGIRYLFDSQGV